MAIMGILAAIAMPRYGNSISLHRVTSAAGRVVADIDGARRQARIVSASQTVAFEAESDSYSCSSGIVQLSQEPYRTDIVSVDFDGAIEIVFDGFGVPDRGGFVVLQVGTFQKTISVDADSGAAIAN